MNIKLMLMRLQSAMGRQDLTEQMVLLPPGSSASNWTKSTESVNLVVGYNSSPSSQMALDLTMWIAHQTRLATQKQVTVQVVYVLDENQSSKCVDFFNSEEDVSIPSSHQLPFELPESTLRSGTPVLTKPSPKALAARPLITSVDRSYFKAMLYQNNRFEQADLILWQARSLAEEWRGSFKAHLRFGCVSEELRKVVESETAALLFLGCNSANHRVVEKLGPHFPCAVLGIPTTLSPSTSA